jgi:hypothetical protein
MTVARLLAVAVTLAASVVAVPSAPNARTFLRDNTSSRVNRSVRLRSVASRSGETRQSFSRSMFSSIEQQKRCGGEDGCTYFAESVFTATLDEFSRLQVLEPAVTLIRTCQPLPARAPPFLL